MTTPIDEPAAQRIAGHLAAVEADRGVRVLWAVESGSRAWGFASPDSDWDVRFVYVHDRDWYLSVDPDARRDVIEGPIADGLDPAGWEVRKALRMFARSNPSLLEWLGSPITYLDRHGFAAALRGLAAAWFSPAAAANHYLSMARNNRRDHLAATQVRLKRYLYVLRPTLAAKWIAAGRGLPPTAFADLLAMLPPEHEQPGLAAAVADLLARKRAAPEMGDGPRIPALDRFLGAEIARLEALAPTLPGRPAAADHQALDRLFRAALAAAWPVP